MTPLGLCDSAVSQIDVHLGAQADGLCIVTPTIKKG